MRLFKVKIIVCSVIVTLFIFHKFRERQGNLARGLGTQGRGFMLRLLQLYGQCNDLLLCSMLSVLYERN